MINNYLKISKRVMVFVASLLFLTRGYAQAPVTQTFVYTGSVQTFTIPACVGTMTVTAYGARGSNGGSSGSAGANGGAVRGVITATPGAVLYINVGGQGSVTAGGFNGGGNGGTSSSSQGGGGGGASDIRLNANTIAARIIVGAGGGGGGGTTTYGPTGGAGGGGNAFSSGTGFGGGGAGGCAIGNPGGESGGTATGYGSGGGGGGFGSGGSGGGQPSALTGGYGCNGLLGAGGDGGGTSFICGGATGGINGGGGGGGGYYGGGGGMTGTGGCNGGGGGGSSWLNNTLFSSPSFTAGNSAADGTVIITYAFNGPGVTVSATPTVICNGQSTTLNAGSVVSQTWSPGNMTAASVVVSPTVNTTYTVQGTNNVGCVSTQTIFIKVDNSPTVTASVSSPSICAGKTVIFTGGGATTYTWTNGITNGVAYAPSGTGDFTVTGTNACGNNTAVASVTVQALPTVSASASSPSICSGNTVVITATGGTGYTISPNVGLNTPFSPLATNNYTVTGAGANTCTNTSVVNVLVINTPTLVPIANPTAICVGATSTISAQGATTYSWIAPNFAGSGQSSVAVNPTVTTTYTLNRANGTCTSTALLTLVVNNLPVIVLSPPTTVCACTGGTTLTAIGAITYTWLPSGAQGGNLNVYPCVTTNYTVGASNNFCSTYSTVLVTASPNPTITINSTTLSICQGNTVGLTANGAPNFTWTSTPNGGPYANSATIVDTPPNSRLYTAAGSSTAGCTAQASQVVLVYPNPTISVASTNTFVCNGGSTTLTASNATNTPTTYSWSNNGSTQSSIVVSPTLSTNYTVTGSYTTGCRTTTVYPLTVYIATFAVNTPSAVCSGVSNTLVATGAALGYTWTTTPPQTGSTAVVAPTVTTIYTVTGVNGLCSATRTVNVPVNPLPDVKIVPDRWVICLFDQITLNGSGASTYTWNGTTVAPSITFSASGNGGPNGAPTISTTFTLTGIDNNGCVKTTTATVFVSNCTGIDEQIASGSSLIVYPNPNAGVFTLKSEKPMELAIVNELGQNVKYVSLTAMEQEVNVSGLANGIYYIIGQENGKIIARKLVVSK